MSSFSGAIQHSAAPSLPRLCVLRAHALHKVEVGRQGVLHRFRRIFTEEDFISLICIGLAPSQYWEVARWGLTQLPGPHFFTILNYYFKVFSFTSHESYQLHAMDKKFQKS